MGWWVKSWGAGLVGQILGCRIGGSNLGVPDRWVKSWGAG